MRHLTAVSAFLHSQLQLSQGQRSGAGEAPLSGESRVTFTCLTFGRAPPAASRPSDDAAPTFVQLGVVSADVVPYIPQSEEGLAAELHTREHKREASGRRCRSGQLLMCNTEERYGFGSLHKNSIEKENQT